MKHGVPSPLWAFNVPDAGMNAAEQLRQFFQGSPVATAPETVPEADHRPTVADPEIILPVDTAAELPCPAPVGTGQLSIKSAPPELTKMLASKVSLPHRPRKNP
jgi:hypothetical protein